ncbi:unnamed protein product [Coregonus sp. 'balchen']|nr:unnamed protein product [Coregonus sp. 'balchen']
MKRDSQVITSCVIPINVTVERERERERNSTTRHRETQGDTGRQGDTETGRQGDRETRRQGDRETGRQGDTETRRHGDRETGRQGDRETGRQGDRETRRQGDTETRRQGDRETGRQGDTETGRHGDTETESAQRVHRDTERDMDTQRETETHDTVYWVQFHRDASVRCSPVHSQSVLQRRRKLRRRKTVIGIPRRVQQDLDSDESPSSRERTVVLRCNAALCSEDLCSRLNTKKDSGCQTEDFLVCAPSRRRVQSQWGQEGVNSAPVPLSLSTGNISSLPDPSERNDAMFSSSLGVRLRSHSQPREGRRLMDEVHHHREKGEELSPSETEDFLSGPGELKEEGEESTDDQAQPDHPLASLKYQQHPGSPWMERGRSRLPRKVDMGSCEMSSSSDTFSSPLHSTSTRGVLGCQMDHKDDHQSSSGNWSGSSSTCPSHTSETLPPATSPQLTGSSHCDSELSLNTAPHATDDPALILDPYQTDRQLDDARVSTASDGEWSYPHPDHPSPRPHDLSPERSREGEGSLGCPSFTSMATCESFTTDKPPSEKADTVSYYSIDTEGYYTSMHFDCGLKGSKSFMYNYSASDCGQEHMTLGRRCLTLRKPKAKPSAPRRSSSLRKINGGGDAPDDSEPKTPSGQQRKWCSRERRLQLDLEGSLGRTDPPDPDPALNHLEDPILGGEGGSGLEQDPLEALETWRREDTEEMPGSGLFGSSDRGSYKDEGAVQSDYADLWLVNDLKSNTDPYRSLSNSSTATGTTVIECIKSQSSESQTSQSGSRATTPSLPSVEDFKMSSLPSVEGDFKMSSPERLAGLVSPSSGYSSQSETPTSSFPSAFFPEPLSPTNQKRKPKIPERKSSLSVTSTRDLELPVIPPSHQDLISTKPPGHRNQLYLLQQSKQKAGASARAEASPATETSSSLPMTITPTVLRSVQLRSVGKQGEGSPDRPGPDVATRPKCPTVNISPPSSSRSPESTARKPPAYNSQVPPSQQYCESLLSPSEGPVTKDSAGHSSVRYRQDRHPTEPQWNQPLLDQDQPLLDQDQPLTDQQSLLDQEVCQRGAEATGVTPGQEVEEQEALFPGSNSSLEAEQYRPQPPEPSKLQRAEDPSMCPAQHSLATTTDSLDKVPVISDQSETISDAAGREEECKSSGVPTVNSRPSDNSIFPLSEETKAEGDVFLSPTKARTTEELFTMIHRSRRKVLGRKDSGELNARSRLCAASGSTSPCTPVNPPGNTVTSLVTPSTPTGPQKAPGPIYRSLKKSSTSNEEFKLLLLKKGSRSDSSYRMSATEILKSPIGHKSPGDHLPTLEEPLSPPPGTEKLPSPFTEGLSPKGMSPAASFRQSRSRVPPPATSSHYSIRSRHHPAPMQAISEGETENSDRSPSSQGSS